jgi:hypothetical protein
MAHHPDMPRSELGLPKGGATRAPNSTVWGTDAFRAPETIKNVPAGEASYQNIGSHGPKPAKPPQPGASEGNPRGFKGAGAPTPRAVSSPPGMIGRRK